MRKIISKIALWTIFIATIAVPQAFAGSVEITADATTVYVGDTVTVQIADVGVDTTVVTSVAGNLNWGDGYVAAVSCSDDGTGTFKCSSTYQYGTTGDYSVSAELYEYNVDGTVSTVLSSSITITVSNLPLVVEAGSDQSVYEGETVSIAPTSTGGSGTLSWAQVEWNDGTMYDFYNALPAGDLAITPTHSYATAGSYSVEVCANDGLVTVCDTLSVTVEQVPLPDLTVTAIEYNADDSTVYYTLANQSDGSVSEDTAGVTQFYYDGVEGPAYDWSSYGDYDFLAAQGSTRFISGIIPEGTQLVTVCVDDDNIVTESNEDNNCMDLSLIPDLAVTSLTYDETSNSVDYTVENNSIIDIDSATAGHTFLVFTNTDGTTDSRAYSWSTLTDISFLSAEGSSSYSYGMGAFDFTQLSSVEICVDALNVVSENDEDNNCMSISLLPDLSVEITDYDATSGVLSYTVSNEGLVSVDSATEGSNYVNITNLDGTEITRAFSWTTLGSLDFLSAEGSSDFQFGAGTMDLTNIYTIEICVDASDLVLESSEQNNCATRVVNELPETDDGDDDGDTTTSFTVEAGADQTITLGDTVTVTAIATSLDATAMGAVANINWADGVLTHSTGVLDASGVTFTETHTYTATGSYVVTVEATQYDVDYADISTVSDTLTITVTDGSTTDGGTTDGGTTDGGTTDGGTTDGGTTDSGSGSSLSSSSATYGGGAGGYYSAGGSSSSSSGDQGVVIAEEGTASGECGEMPFTDVNPNASYYDAIYNAWCKEIVDGRTPTMFTPSDQILRGEVAKVVALTFGYPPVTSLDWTPYTDVDPSQDLSPYVLVLNQVGLLEGYENEEGGFDFDEAMTVSDIETLIERIVGGSVDLSAYSDNGSTVSRGRFIEFMDQYISD